MFLQRRKRSRNGVFKIGLDIFLKRSIETSVVNSHTVTYKPIALTDNLAQLEFNCSGHSDYYKDLNSVRLLLRIKLVKTDRSDIENNAPKLYVVSSVCCIEYLVLSVFKWKASYSPRDKLSLQGLHRKLLNYGFDASSTHLISSFWYLDSPGEFKENTGYANRSNYLSNGKT